MSVNWQLPSRMGGDTALTVALTAAIPIVVGVLGVLAGLPGFLIGSFI